MPIIKSKERIGNQTVEIYVEVDSVAIAKNVSDENMRGGVDKVLKTAKDVFGSGLQLASNCAMRVVESINKMEKKVRPAEFQVQLSIKLDSEVGAILARASAGAQMQVSMKWVNKE